jgi:hypothetical protein
LSPLLSGHVSDVTWPDKRGDNLVVFNYLSTSETWPDKRGDNLVVFNYLNASETWPDKRGDNLVVFNYLNAPLLSGHVSDVLR